MLELSLDKWEQGELAWKWKCHDCIQETISRSGEEEWREMGWDRI